MSEGDARRKGSASTPSRPAIPITPFPSSLIDQVMPALRDTEWRLLCIIVRQTLGWKDTRTGGRKTSDWLTQKQLIARTGRSSEAVSKAVDMLVHSKLIEVRSNGGTALDSAQERRQARSRLHYSLHPHLVRGVSNGGKMRSLAPISNSLLRRSTRKSEFGEAAKANGTKENTKETVTNEQPAIPNPVAAFPAAVSTASDVSHDMLQEVVRPVEEVDGAVTAFVHSYRQKYAQYRCGSGPPSYSVTALERLGTLLQQSRRDECIRLLDLFFSSDLHLARRQQYSLDSFIYSLHLLRLIEKRSMSAKLAPPINREYLT